MSRVIRLLLLTTAVLLLQACQVPLQPYRVQHPAIEVPPPALNGPAVTQVKPAQDCVSASSPICLAFIEVDDMGELWDKGELDTALGVIRRANTNPQADPVVLTFVHGWKNNAAPDNGNVAGFQAALQDLYARLHRTRPIIGIYIGWRGNLIRDSWPVAQQFSYFNREATATRIPSASLSSALTEIAMRTHEDNHALAIFIGHSFGGLLLERALSEMTAGEIAQDTIYTQEAAALPAGSAESAEKLRLAAAATDARADLVIFINPAGAATEAKPMLDFLISNSYRYQPFLANGSPAGAADPPGDPHGDNTADRPLFVSLTSTSDLATKVAVPIGHALPELRYKMAGSFRNLGDGPSGNYELSCFDPHAPRPHWTLKTEQEGAVPQSSYYMNTAPHMQILQSHVMLKAIGKTQMQVASTGQKITIQNPQAIAQCNRDLFNQQHLNVVSTFRLADTQTCFAVQERPDRCNGSPYWMMEIDPDVVPDHSTIFTQRFIDFLIDTFFITPEGGAMQRPHPRLFTQ
jgi:hypothetical protein